MCYIMELQPFEIYLLSIFISAFSINVHMISIYDGTYTDLLFADKSINGYQYSCINILFFLLVHKWKMVVLEIDCTGRLHKFITSKRKLTPELEESLCHWLGHFGYPVIHFYIAISFSYVYNNLTCKETL